MTVTLKPHQTATAERLAKTIPEAGWAIDASDTGTGKTFTALQTCKLLGKRPLILCPKSTKTGWRRAAQDFGIEVLDVLTPEALRLGKQKWYKKDTKWQVPRDVLVIADEWHRGTSTPDAALNQIFMQTKAFKIPLLALSATPAVSPLNMRAVGFLAGFYNGSMNDFYRFCRQNGCYRPPNDPYKRWFPSKGPKGEAIMATLRANMGSHVVRNRREDLKDFPECDTQIELVDVAQDLAEINKQYAAYDAAFGNGSTPPEPLPVELQARVEAAKQPVLLDMCKDYVEEGMSVVVFFNLRKSVELLYDSCVKEGLPTVWMTGELDDAKRQEAIDKFQANEAHVFICTAGAGGPGISLHDVHHQRPRVALLVPSWDPRAFTQCLGRIHRVGGTKALQKIILAAQTIEEACYKRMMGLCESLDAFNANV